MLVAPCPPDVLLAGSHGEHPLGPFALVPPPPAAVEVLHRSAVAAAAAAASGHVSWHMPGATSSVHVAASSAAQEGLGHLEAMAVLSLCQLAALREQQLQQQQTAGAAQFPLSMPMPTPALTPTSAHMTHMIPVPTLLRSPGPRLPLPLASTPAAAYGCPPTPALVPDCQAASPPVTPPCTPTIPAVLARHGPPSPPFSEGNVRIVGKKRSASSASVSSTCSSATSARDGGASPTPLMVPPKPKRKRASPAQLAVLNAMYAESPFPSTELRHKLAVELGMTPRAVQIWFQNKRQTQKSKQLQAEAGLMGAPTTTTTTTTKRVRVCPNGKMIPEASKRLSPPPSPVRPAPAGPAAHLLPTLQQQQRQHPGACASPVLLPPSAGYPGPHPYPADLELSHQRILGPVALPASPAPVAPAHPQAMAMLNVEALEAMVDAGAPSA